MLLIYFHENPEDTQVAQDVAKTLRLNDISCGLRNAAFWNAQQFERAEAILAINCEDVAQAYEERNQLIQLAHDRGDIARYAGTPMAEVFRSPDEVFAALEQPESEQPESEQPAVDLDKMTVAQLHAFAAEKGIEYSASANKAELLASIKSAIA